MEYDFESDLSSHLDGSLPDLEEDIELNPAVNTTSNDHGDKSEMLTSTLKRKLENEPIASAETIQRTITSSNNSQNTSQDFSFTLLNELLNDTNTMELLSTKWRSYSETDSSEFMRGFLNLILLSCNCQPFLNHFDMEDTESIPETLAQIQSSTFNSIANFAEPYLYACSTGTGKSFRTKLSFLVNELINMSIEKDRLSSSSFMETIKSWILCMTTSPWLSIRHTSSAISCMFYVALANALSKFEDGRDFVEGDENQSLFENLNYLLDDIYKSAILIRIRDTRSIIRLECFLAIHECCLLLPSHLQNRSTLLYLGWGLSDTDARIRKVALKIIQQLFITERKQELSVTSLNFLERFSSKIAEICRYDIESVRAIALQLCFQLLDHQLLSQDDIELLCLCIFNKKAQIRSPIMRLLVRYCDQTLEGFLKQATKETSLKKILSRENYKISNSAFKNLFKENLIFSFIAQALETWTIENVQANSSQSDDRNSVWPFGFNMEAKYLENSEEWKVYEGSMLSIHNEMNSLGSWEEVLGYLLFDHVNHLSCNSILKSCAPNEKIIDFLSSYVYFCLNFIEKPSFLKRKSSESDYTSKQLHLLHELPLLMKKYRERNVASYYFIKSLDYIQEQTLALPESKKDMLALLTEVEYAAKASNNFQINLLCGEFFHRIINLNLIATEIQLNIKLYFASVTDSLMEELQEFLGYIQSGRKASNHDEKVGKLVFHLKSYCGFIRNIRTSSEKSDTTLRLVSHLLDICRREQNELLLYSCLRTIFLCILPELNQKRSKEILENYFSVVVEASELLSKRTEELFTGKLFSTIVLLSVYLGKSVLDGTSRLDDKEVNNIKTLNIEEQLMTLKNLSKQLKTRESNRSVQPSMLEDEKEQDLWNNLFEDWYPNHCRDPMLLVDLMQGLKKLIL
ncbi:meiotic cohesin complex subunit Rec11 [Schizosaccharomyces cryophilus OY26]|uniref:Meiotic cohesin complex subunit Rec11 n=1 Tax=Schizosaccharomyces cryophilus (strain OY26 / ATCC MYA-4695 / CBS 11777 / NBRC 106824 / NRRL Y48691) TaxID=653667 RepID=S9XA22_SCHCR|nr:meiotic cohesin complex subunit Rec11 [Schizosaccharomyces cryophilus OY26]EPY50606.1 meiotic cohesin complex subunit Rec11 [Schizosaccharomyces cryophilus OY26]